MSSMHQHFQKIAEPWSVMFDMFQLHGLPKSTLCVPIEGSSLQAIGDETNTVGLDGLSERCAKYYKQGDRLYAPLGTQT